MAIIVEDKIRKLLDDRQVVKFNAIRKDPMFDKEIHVPVRDCEIRCLEFVPKDLKDEDGKKKEQLPVVFDVHGGGFTNGYPEEDDYICRRLADNLKVRVFSIDYRLAPDHPYPEGQLDVYEVVKHIHDHAEEYGILPEKMIIQGHSAGGNLSTTCVIRSIESGDFSFIGQILDYPPLDFITDPNDKFWTEGAIPPHLVAAFDACYALPEQRKEYLVSPLYTPDEILAKFPSTVIISCEIDSLRDEEEAYALKIAKNGVEVTLKRVLGAKHAYSIVYEDPKSLESYQMMEEGVRRFISRKAPEKGSENAVEGKSYTSMA